MRTEVADRLRERVVLEMAKRNEPRKGRLQREQGMLALPLAKPFPPAAPELRVGGRPAFSREKEALFGRVGTVAHMGVDSNSAPSATGILSASASKQAGLRAARLLAAQVLERMPRRHPPPGGARQQALLQ